MLYNPRNGTFTEILAKKGNFSVMNSKVKRSAFTEARFKQGNGPDVFYDVHRYISEDMNKSPRDTQRIQDDAETH